MKSCDMIHIKSDSQSTNAWPTLAGRLIVGRLKVGRLKVGRCNLVDSPKLMEDKTESSSLFNRMH